MGHAQGQARFGDFVFDPESGELRRGEETFRLQPQPAQVLSVLLHRTGNLVTREELKQEIWPDTFVEFDQGLNYCIRQIRAVLGDAVDEPRYIETLHRRGYRFLEPVEWDTAKPSPKGWRAGLVAGVAVAVMLMLTFGAGSDGSGPSTTPLRVAVIPLQEERPGHALTESLVTELTNAGMGLDVLGPATTAGLERDSRPDTEIGAALNVAYVISGGIRAVDSGLFVQAVRVYDGAHVFARIIAQPLVRVDSSMRRLAGDLARDLRGAVPDSAGDRP